MMKRWSLVLIAGLVALLCFTSTVKAQEATLIYSRQDSTLVEDLNGELSNGLGDGIFVGRTNQPVNSIRRGLVAFDVASVIPAGAEVIDVSLTLEMVRTPSGNQDIELHRLLSPWSEGNSDSSGGRGVLATTDDATWLHTSYADQQLWNQPGGDFAPTASAVQSVGTEGTYTWSSTPELVSDVQAWVDSPEENFGWLLLGNEAEPRTVKVFSSKESDTQEYRPTLQVTFR